MTSVELLYILFAMRAFELFTLGFLVIAICSVWPRVTWRRRECEETGTVDETHEATVAPTVAPTVTPAIDSQLGRATRRELPK